MVFALEDIRLEGKKVLLRCDFNVPLKDGKIADPSRIDASLDTIRHVLKHGAAAVLCSHLGRPKGGPSAELSLKPVAQYLSRALGDEVPLAPDCVGEQTERLVESLEPGHALLLENLRFHREEEANDPGFSRSLAHGKHVYVNDAFGTAHRAHASTAGVAAFLQERAAGLLMMREIKALRALLENPARPYVAVLGGAKVSDKIGVIRNLMARVDAILVGGAMAYTFLKARGVEVGRSRLEADKIDLARGLMDEAGRRGVKFVLPCDHVVAAEAKADASGETVTEIPPDKMALDIGPRTVKEFVACLNGAKTVVWNGPLGFCEAPAFAKGTLKFGEALAAMPSVFSVLGGGDTAAAVKGRPWTARFSHISTGGGATLEFLEGLELPGIKALER
jgi:phosphoglycerate kinase